MLGALLVGVLAWVWNLSRPLHWSEPASNESVSRANLGLAERLTRFEADERAVDETVWATEMLAQKCGRTFELLWDSVNAGSNKLSLIASFPVGEVVLGDWRARPELAHGIAQFSATGSGRTVTGTEWPRFVGDYERAGWRLGPMEIRHHQFDPDEKGEPGRSLFHFSAHLVRPAGPERAVLEGDLEVDWLARSSQAAVPTVKRIDARQLKIQTRMGPPAFATVLSERIDPPARSTSIDPLLLYDLDGDGLSEIILAAQNLVYRRQSGGRYVAQPLCRFPPGSIFTAILADFDGAGAADFLCAKAEGLMIYPGSSSGSFDQPGQMVWTITPHLQNGMVLTCGDVDHDGDLDLFLGQYRVPTLGQILRPNFYDANDGHPAYLLQNDGHGHFADATGTSGLERKRWRRIFSASLADLDDDGHLDLLVVSDFAGADLYRGDGAGRFREVTREWLPEAKGFGMGHTLSDFNADGRLDWLMIGMGSPTVDRVEHLGLSHPSATEDRTMRKRMTSGNRLYMARAKSTAGFEQTPLNEGMARSGWSWGCSAFDFDNDGFPDVYIANGQESKQSVQDYEPEFWLHDLHVAPGLDDRVATLYFASKFSRTRGQGWSYGGYDKDRLFWNQNGQSFVEIGHLMGVALEQDSRNVVTDDLNGDGRVDLLVTTLEVWPEPRQTLQIFQNKLAAVGNWVGFRFREGGAGRSPAGVRVTLRGQGFSSVRQIVTGDSFRSQHANTVHFGLGKSDRVESVEIRWPNGEVRRISEPALNRYHAIDVPVANSVQP